MRDIPKELTEKVKKYSLMIAWWYIHEGDKEVEDKLQGVLDKIEQTEIELSLSGINNDIFEDIIQRAKHFVGLKVGEMNDNQLETMCKLIFGQDTKIRSFDKRVLSKRGFFCFDPTTYEKKND